MSNVIVRVRTQHIIVDPATQSIAVINAGPPGPPGIGGGGGGDWDGIVLDEDDFHSNSATLPPSQQSVAAWANGRFPTDAEVAALLAPSPLVLTYTGGAWPSAAGVSATRCVMWIQPNIGGTSPPAGGRPGRAPGDLVFIRQS